MRVVAPSAQLRHDAPAHAPPLEQLADESQRERDQQDDCDAGQRRPPSDARAAAEEHHEVDRQQYNLEQQVQGQDGGAERDIALRQGREHEVPVGTGRDQQHQQADAHIRTLAEEQQAEQEREHRSPDEVDESGGQGEPDVLKGPPELLPLDGQEHEEQQRH